MKERVLVVGGSPMGKAYIAVLKAMKCEPVAVTRREESAQSCAKAFQCEAHSGGIERFCADQKITFEHAIVAVDIPSLAKTAALLIKSGTKRILLEKPGGLGSAELEELEECRLRNKTEVFIGYNRRFYGSVIAARQAISEDGGLTSLLFDFTEWPDKISPLKTAPEVKARWALANSSHVIDLAFHLAGFPERLDSHVSGGLPWHPSGSVFTGSGNTVSGVPFVYHADWTSAGRWGVELFTAKRRLVLRPLEEVWAQQRNSLDLVKLCGQDQVDTDYKPGIYRQTKAFMEGDAGLLAALPKQLRMVTLVEKMAGYNSCECVIH